VNRRLTTAHRIGALIAALAGLLFFAPSAGPGAHNPPLARADEPVITYQFPEEGDVLKERPFVLQMCFKEPVNVNDLDKGGDFRFRILTADGKGLGIRIVFQPDGYGVALYPGNPAEGQLLEGEWTWEYRLTDKVKTSDAIEGEIKFKVDPQNGKDIITATPPACLAAGATPLPTAPIVGTASPEQSGAPTTGATGTPAPRQSATPTATPGSAGVGGEEEGGTDVDILRLALLTIGAAGSAAVLALIGYAIRKRVGYEPHAPHDGETPSEHH